MKKKFKDTKFGKFAGNVAEATKGNSPVDHHIDYVSGTKEQPAWTRFLPIVFDLVEIFKDGKVGKDEVPKLIGVVSRLAILIAALKGIEVLI